MKIKNSFKKIFFVLVFVLTLSFANNVFADTISYYYGNTKINGIFPSYYTPGEEVDLPIGEQVAPTVGEHGRFVIDNLYDNPELTGNPITKILATDSGDKTFYMKGHYNVYCVYVKKYSSDTWSNSECVRIGNNYNLGINNVNKADQIDPMTTVHFRNYYNEHYAHVKIHYEKNGWDVYDATYHRLIQHYNDGESFVVPNYDIEIKPSYIETRVSPEFEEVVGTYGWISTNYKAQPEFDPNYPTNYVSNYLINSYTGTSDITVEPIYQVNQICHYMIEGEYEYFHEVPCGTIITLPVNDTATTYYYGYHEFHNADNSPDYVSDIYLKTENVANGWRVSGQGYYYDGDQIAILKDNTLISRYTRTIRHTLYDAPEIDDPHFIEWRVNQSNTWFEYTEHDVLNVYQDIYPLYDYPTSKISFYSTYTDDQGLHLNPLAVYRYYTLDVDSMKLTNNLNYFENETNQVSYYPALGFYLPNVSSINKDYRFVEFYDNPEFTGDPITYIEPNENGGDITLYVKEVHNNTLNNLYPDKHVTVTFHSHIANGWPAEGFRDYTEEEYYLKSEDGYAHVAITNDHFAYSWQSGVGNYVRLNYHVGDEIVDTELVDFTFYDPAKEGDQSSVVYQWRDADGNIYNRSNYDNSHDNIYLFDHDIDLYSIDFDYDNYLPIASIVEADWLGRSISWDWTRTYPCDAPEGMICYWSDEPNGDPIIKSNALFYNNSYLKRNYNEMREDNIFDFITMKFQRERQLSDIDLYAVYVVPTEHSVTFPYVVDVAYEEVPYELPGHNIPKASEVVATLTADEYTSRYINEELDENGRYTSNVVRKYNPFGWRIEGTDYVYPFESEINVDDDITLVPEYTGSIQPAYMPAKKSLQNIRFDLTLTERRLNDYVLGNAYFGQENAEVYVENVEQKINFDYGLEGDEEHYEYWEGPYGSINLAKLYKIGAKYNSPDLVAFEIYVNGELVDVEESEVYQDEDSSDYEQFYYIRSSEYDSSHNENDYNITVKAVYDEDINTYTIKDTTGLYFDTIEYNNLSDDIVIPNPTKLGYIFTGWTFNYNCRYGIGECNSSLANPVKNVTIAKGSGTLFSNIQLTPNFEEKQVTVTKYDNHNNSTIEVYDYGYEYNLGVNDYTYSSVLYDAKVTFVHADQTEESGYVAIGNKANGWLVDSTHYDNNTVITLVNDITIRPDKTEVKTSPEFPATQNGYGWYTESGERLIGYTGTKNITLYEMPANETYEIIFGVETDGPRGATNPDFSTLTYSKNNLHYGDTFQVPSLDEYPDEDFCFTHCYKNKYNTWWLTNFFSEDEGWKPELYLHYMDDDDTVKDASKDTLYLQTKKKKLRLYYEEYDSYHRLINTVDRYLEYGGTYTFDYNRNLYDVGLQQEGGTNVYDRVNIHRVGEPMGVVVEIPEHYNPDYETNDVEIPEGYEFDGWYTEPNGQGEKYSYEAFKYKYLDKATVTDIYYATVDDLEDRIIKDYDTTNFTGFEPIHLYAHYVPKQTTTHTVTYPNGDIYEVEDGQTHTLLSNNESKASENIATVTFKYSDNRLPDATSYVQNTYIPNGWLIGDINYADGTDIVVTEDIVLVPDFVETTIGATFPEVVDNDYYRSEWRTRSYCGGGSLVTSYNGTSNITYYESYKRVLHFDEDNGTPIYTKTFCENDYFMCSDALGYAEKDGTYFNGWTLYIDGEDVAYYDASQFEANGGPGSELYFDSYYLYNNEGYALVKADYSLMSYYISYNLNGGTVSGNPRSYTIEDEITLNNPTKEGFEFAGWGGTGLTGTNNMTVTIPAGSTGDRSYTAYWSTNKTITLGTNDIDRPDELLATVTFNPHNGGAITTSDVIKTYTPNGWLVNGKHYVDGETIIVPVGSIAVPNFVERIIPAIYPSNPTKDGYEFEGWYDDATEGNKVSAYSGNEDITLHARYTDNYAYLDVNFNFNQKLSDLVSSGDATNFRKATLDEYNAVKDSLGSSEEINSPSSPKEVYMWKNGKDILYYSDADVIYFPEDSSEYFAYIPYIRNLDISGLNTSKVINMTSMFERNEDDYYNTNRFTDINLSNFDTHNVKYMSRLFRAQGYLNSLDLSNFDTRNVTDMYEMFYFASPKSNTIDISNFDTSNVTDMSGMFNRFLGNVIGLENLNTSKVTNMSYMFNNSHFHDLDLSGWDVSNVTNMEYMFDRAARLVNLDVSTWDVSKVEKMTHMFYYDYNLPVLDLRSWDTSNVTYTAEMFARCENLQTIYVSDKWDMDNVPYGLFMFDRNFSIVGEKGTTYDESFIDYDYAHIDDAPNNPGYLSERLYETPKYTITFDGGEYFPTYSRLVDNGNEIGKMPTYSSKYNEYGMVTFGGWYTDKTYTTEVTEDFVPTGNITLYAKPECELGYPGDLAPDGPEEIVGMVTFEPHNGEQAFTSFIYKEYHVYDKWLVDDEIHQEGEIITLYPETVIEPYYEGIIQDVYFPTRLTYVGHNFLGWFTEEEGGTQLTSYNQEESITLHAHWERNGKNICTYSNGKIEECEAGKSYRVPSNEYVKIGKVTEIVNGYGAYENAVYNTYDIYAENIINSYEIDGILYYPGDNYVINGDTYITVDGHRSYVSTVYLDSYVDIEVNSEWFDGEEKYFLGWFTEPIGGEQIITYNGAESINVYAHYYDNPDDVVLLTFNGIQDSYEIKVLKGTEFTPYDAGEDYTAYFNLDYQDGRPLVPGYQRQYKKPTGFDVNGRVIDVGDTVVINEDTLVTTLSDGYKSELSDFETPYKEGYIFKGWYDAPEDGNFANFNSEDFYVYTDTYYAQYAPYNSTSDVIVDFDGEKFVYPRGTVLTLPDDREKEGKYFYADFYDGTDYVGCLEIETSYTLRNFTVNNVEYDIGANITLNEDTVIISNFDEVTNYNDYTLEQYPDLVYPNFPDFGLEDTFYGWFDRPTGGKQYYDASEFKYEDKILYAIYTDGNQIPITVDGEVIIVNKGLGNLPNSKNKASENIADVTFDYNKEGYTNETASITKDYTFDHFTIDGEGNYMPNQEYNFTNSIAINSVYTESYNYPEIPTVTDESFQGWYTNKTGGDLVTSLESITSDTTLYANWDNNGIIVCVNNNCNEVPEGTIYNLGQNTESKDADIISTVTFEYHNGQSPTTSNVTRQYTPNGWLVNGVHYDDNADITILQETEIEPDFVDAIVGAPFPEDPEGSETATFIGWSVADPLDLPRGNQFTYCSDDELCDDFITSYNYTEDVYLDAIYTVTYTLVCDPENPQVDGTYTIDFRDGSTIVFPNMNTQPCSKLGYEFYGFRGHQNGNEVYHLYVYDFDYLGNGFFGINTDDYTLPVEVNPIYRLENYDIKLNLDGGYFENGYTPNYFTIEDDDTEIPNPVKDGYTFVGWTGEGITEPTKNLIIPSGSYGDKEYTAVFGKNYTITYPDGEEETIYEGQVITLPVNTESKDDDYVSTVYFYDYASDDSTYYETISEQEVFKSYTPNGWLIDDVHYDDEQEITVTGDIYLEPDYNEILSDVTIPTENNLEHYTFNGWYEYEEGSGEEVDLDYINDYLNDGYDVYAYAYRIGEELTITTPNGIEVVNYGDEYDLDYTDDDITEDAAAITFKYNDNKTVDEVRYVEKTTYHIGWLVNGAHYDGGSSITVTENIVVEPEYEYSYESPSFPEASRDNYTFEGWFNNDIKYTSYEGTEDIILTAKWTGSPIIVCDGNDCREEPYGTEIDLGVNNRDKNDTVVSTVTFDYHFDDGSDNPYEYVMKQYTPNGWLVNGVHYDDNANITITENTNIQPDYLETIIPVYFPETVNRQGYIFKGWFTQATGGEKLTSYAGENSILVHAQYDKEKIIVEEPDGEHEYEYGDEYTFKAVPTKANENIAKVTFKPENGESDIVKYVQKQYTPVDWILNGTHYNAGDKITLTENIKPTPQYTENVIPASFPEDPEKEHYVFEGWFNNDTKYTSYEGTEDITLTAKWTGSPIQVCVGTDCQEVPYDTEMNLGVNNKGKDDSVVSVVTYDYHFDDGSDNPYEYVMKQYTPNGWLVNGVHYDDNTNITITENTNIQPDYLETIIPVNFPETVNRQGYIFKGWYTQATGGEKLTSYAGENSILVHAQYDKEKIIVEEPDGEHEYEYGDEYTFKAVPTKANENIATVTFKPENGENDTIRYVQKQYTPVDWILNGTHYNAGDKITLTENIKPTPQYTENVIPVSFPSDPEKEHYVFEGWFNNDIKYTSYEGTENIILTAIYSKEKITVTEPDGEHEYEYGDEYTFKAVPTKANENIAEVTFKPENGDEDIVKYVQKVFTPYGWELNGTHYEEGDTITLTENINPTPYYIEILAGVEFPEDPEKENYNFEGWFNNDTKYTSYADTEDIILNAEWSDAGPTSITINSRDMVIVKGSTKEVDITTNPVNLNNYLTYTGYSNIITVTDTGIVEAIETGETTITVSTTNNPDIEETINVKVIDNKITSDVYTVTTKDKTGEEINIIIGSPEQVTINDYLDNINNENEYLKVYNKDDELVSDYDELITTGYTIKLVVDDQELDSVRVIIRGDVDQDGYIDVSDKLAIKRHILEIDVITDYRLYAADLDVDPEATIDTMIDVSDNLKLALYILEKIESLNEEVGD